MLRNGKWYRACDYCDCWADLQTFTPISHDKLGLKCKDAESCRQRMHERAVAAKQLAAKLDKDAEISAVAVAVLAIIILICWRCFR
ncbi:MAG: hypothetical protein K2W95_15565 [Candidatus Obscuribacterales bacterium]|nr:hypothetical protein [Candidatus Obscuribacterales bacterium]